MITTVKAVTTVAAAGYDCDGYGGTHGRNWAVVMTAPVGNMLCTISAAHKVPGSIPGGSMV